MFVIKELFFCVVINLFRLSTLTSIATKNNFDEKCQLKFRFARICHFYDFHSSSAIENGCHPTNLIACPIIKVKKLESKCPVYECKVKAKYFIIYKLKTCWCR